MAGILFIISAPSGSGKSTLVNQLRSMIEGLEFSVSYTTRCARGSEEDGREYHFTTRAKFEEMIAAEEFLEWAEVFGNYYGTAASTLSHASEQGKDLLLDIDVQGAKQVMQRVTNAVSIFIMPPSPETLELRLRNRSAAEHMADETIIGRRLAQARSELEVLRMYHYAIVNDVLETAVSEMRAIVLTARKDVDVEDAATAKSCLINKPSLRLLTALNSFHQK